LALGSWLIAERRPLIAEQIIKISISLACHSERSEESPHLPLPLPLLTLGTLTLAPGAFNVTPGACLLKLFSSKNLSKFACQAPKCLNSLIRNGIIDADELCATCYSLNRE
jgi:hypothetical protein